MRFELTIRIAPSSKWTKLFSRAMDTLSEPLLNGAHSLEYLAEFRPFHASRERY